MPDVDAEKHKLHQFLTGLPSAVTRQLRATGEINNLEKVLEWAKLLMTINEEQAVAVKQKDRLTEVDELKQQISMLCNQVAALTMQRSGATSPIQLVCYNCPVVFVR